LLKREGDQTEGAVVLIAAHQRIPEEEAAVKTRMMSDNKRAKEAEEEQIDSRQTGAE
jgi:hypothetical protein